MSESKRKSSFEDHLNIISSANGQTKTASVKTGGADLLAKLAAELGINKEAEGGTIPLVGEKAPAEATPAGANAAVVAATETLVTPQLVMAGGNPAVVAAGEIPAASAVPQEPIISSGTGDAQTAQTLNKTDEATAAAARGAGGSGETGKLQSAAVAQNPESEKNAAEAVKIGQLIAKSFQETLEKQAEDVEYAQALQLLDQNGMLQGYKINDMPMTKTASYEAGCLEKLANKQAVSRKEIISAAYELLDLEKQASDAEEEGRQQARDLVALMTKIAEGEEAAKEETEEEKKKRLAAEAKKEGETEGAEKAENEKMAALRNDPAVMGAIKVLKFKGVI